MTTIYVLYGTETYNAEGLAQRSAAQLVELGYSADVIDMADVECEHLAQMEYALLITSTFGDGEPPSNAEAVFDELMDSGAPSLLGLSYSVCALGDSDYEHFCQCGKDFDRRLRELNAKPLVARVDCDTDFEAPWAGWLDRVIEQLPPAEMLARPADGESIDQSVSASVNMPSISEPPQRSVKSSSSATRRDAEKPRSPSGTRKNPATVSVLQNVNLNHPTSDKETRHVAIAIAETELQYRAGDALGVFARNCPDLVRRVLSAVRLKRDTPVLVDGQYYAIKDVLIYKKDVMQIDRRLVDLVVKQSTQSGLTERLANSDSIRTYCANHHVLDLLLAAQVRLSAESFLACLKPLAPRLYSISSSPEAYPNEIHLTVNVLRYDLHGMARKGVASTFLGERAGPGVELAVYIQRTRDFLLCEDHIPIIMIGPGTGIAPFRAFLQEREARGASGQSWLFFGAPHESMDFLYRDELVQWRNEGLLARLDLAWSRDQEHKVYVQDRLYANGRAIFRWIEAGAVIYVCGDKQRMAKDVERTLIRICQEFGRLSFDDASTFLKDLQTQKRYLKDVY